MLLDCKPLRQHMRARPGHICRAAIPPPPAPRPMRPTPSPDRRVDRGQGRQARQGVAKTFACLPGANLFRSDEPGSAFDAPMEGM
jgi:hypothetical protein